MKINFSDLQMIVAPLFMMIDEEPPEECVGPCRPAVLWSSITLGDEGVKLHVGADEDMMERFKAGFGGGSAQVAESDDFDSAVIREVANVVGGNVRGALCIEGSLGLPEVVEAPAGDIQCFETWDSAAHLWIAIEGVELDEA